MFGELRGCLPLRPLAEKMRYACSMVAFVEGGLPFCSLVFHQKFLDQFVEIVECFVGGS